MITEKEEFEVTFITFSKEFEILVEAASMGRALRAAIKLVESRGVHQYEVMQITKTRLYDESVTIGRVAEV